MAAVAVVVYLVIVVGLIGLHSGYGVPLRGYHTGDLERHRAEYLFWAVLLGAFVGALTWMAYGWLHTGGEDSSDK
jgi:hypothetical protein